MIITGDIRFCKGIVSQKLLAHQGDQTHEALVFCGAGGEHGKDGNDFCC